MDEANGGAVNDIATFILERLAEDEVVGRTPNLTRVAALNWIVATHVEGGMAVVVDPDRVLDDVESKRRIVEMHQSTRMAGRPTCDTCADPVGRGEVDWPCNTLRLLALPYRSHRDYQEGWAI